MHFEPADFVSFTITMLENAGNGRKRFLYELIADLTIGFDVVKMGQERGHFYNVLNSPLGLLKDVFQMVKDLAGLGFEISLDN
jgi:hypothetical protein